MPGLPVTSSKTGYGAQIYGLMTDFNKVAEAVQIIRQNLPTIVFDANGVRIIPVLSTVKMSDYSGNVVTITCDGVDGSYAEFVLCEDPRGVSGAQQGQISPPIRWVP